MPVEGREGGVVGVVLIAVDFVIVTTVHEMYAHMLACSQAHMHTCTHVHTHASPHTYMHACMHAHR